MLGTLTGKATLMSILPLYLLGSTLKGKNLLHCGFFSNSLKLNFFYEETSFWKGFIAR